jgi:hypothetical protein
MRRAFPLLLLTGLLVPFAASAGTSVGWSVTIGNAPPPPVVVVSDEPHMVLVPNTTVYAVDDGRVDYDSFHYGIYWYACKGDYWYRARSWRGPYTVLEARYVPRPIFSVPARNWRYHHPGPRGYAYGYYRDHDRDYYRDRDRDYYRDRGRADYRDHDRDRGDRDRRSYDPRYDGGRDRDHDVANRDDHGKGNGHGRGKGGEVADRGDDDNNNNNSNNGKGHGHDK